MLLSIIVILVLTRLSTCTDSAGTNLVFVEYDGYAYGVSYADGPYLKTGVLEGRPVYNHTDKEYQIIFRDNQWLITRGGVLLYKAPALQEKAGMDL